MQRTGMPDSTIGSSTLWYYVDIQEMIIWTDKCHEIDGKWTFVIIKEGFTICWTCNTNMSPIKGSETRSPARPLPIQPVLWVVWKKIRHIRLHVAYSYDVHNILYWSCMVLLMRGWRRGGWVGFCGIVHSIYVGKVSLCCYITDVIIVRGYVLTLPGM